MANRASDLNEILTTAVSMGASDIHIAVGARPRCRIYGTLRDMDYLMVNDAVADDLLIQQTSMDTLARSTLNTTGQWDFSHEVLGVARFRVNVFRQKGSLAGVFRILNTEVPDYSKLGLPTSVFALQHKRRGLVLVVGATGSGKSTTLASIIDVINKNQYKHIITLEDPMEYVHWHSRCIINQREIGSDVDSFSSGLRAALREDPDVILIGEMRDFETVDTALKAAETGHLVCSTLHTMGVADTLNRILDMYPESQQRQVRSMLDSVLEAVIAQQLLPRKDGKGYVLAYEIMYKNKRIRELLREGNIEDVNNYLETRDAIEDNMCSMDSCILRHYKRGLITRDTALNYAFDAKQMAKKTQ